MTDNDQLTAAVRVLAEIDEHGNVVSTSIYVPPTAQPADALRALLTRLTNRQNCVICGQFGASKYTNTIDGIKHRRSNCDEVICELEAAQLEAALPTVEAEPVLRCDVAQQLSDPDLCDRDESNDRCRVHKWGDGIPGKFPTDDAPAGEAVRCVCGDLMSEHPADVCLVEGCDCTDKVPAPAESDSSEGSE